MIRKTILCCILLFPLFVQAQREQVYRIAFDLGKSYYLEGEYGLALESLKAALDQNPQNPYAPYAYFYSGLAAYKSGKYYVARFHFQDVINLFPDFTQKQDVYFWLSLVHLQQGEWEDFRSTVKQVYADTLRMVIAQKRSEVLEEEPDEVIVTFYNENTNDRVVAEILARRIAQKPLEDQDQELLFRLIRSFGFSGPEYGVISTSIKKDTYRIAAMLPFLKDELSTEKVEQGNQFVLDFYQGLLLAAEKLDSMGIHLAIYPYDTRTSLNTTESLLALPEMKTMDLIIGPIYPAPLAMVNDFCLKNQINQVHPFSTNPDLIHPYSFLFHPSTRTEGKKAAQLSAMLLQDVYRKDTVVVMDSLTGNQSLVIVPDSVRAVYTYYPTSRDSLASAEFRQYLIADSSYHVSVFDARENKNRPMNDFTAVYMVDETNRYDEEGNRIMKVSIENKQNLVIADSMVIPLDSVQLIYAPSGNAVLAGSVISSTQARPDTIIVIGRSSWLDFQFLTYEQLGKLPVYFFADEYVDYRNPKVVSFREGYYKRWARYPNNWSYVGYELMYFYGQMLHNFGNYFQIGMQQLGFFKGELFSGFDYTNANDNQHIPVIRVVGFDIETVAYE